MEMKFKTNMKCDGCVSSVKPYLDSTAEIESWSVDLNSPEKTLTVKTGSLKKDEVIAIVSKAGFKAESK
jgi:copper chaperone